MMTIGELVSIIDQNMINNEKRKEILNCLCTNFTITQGNFSLDLLLTTLETFKSFVIFIKECLREKVILFFLYLFYLSKFRK